MSCKKYFCGCNFYKIFLKNFQMLSIIVNSCGVGGICYSMNLATASLACFQLTRAKVAQTFGSGRIIVLMKDFLGRNIAMEDCRTGALKG